MENLDFETAIQKLEDILDKLENNNDLSSEEAQKLYDEAEALKNHCRTLLNKEKDDIIKIAKENNIPLEELDLDDEFDEDDEDEEDDEDFDEDDEDEEDDEE